MKTKLFLSVLFTFVFYLLSSQVPQGFNYQALAGDASGNPLRNTDLQVKISILSDTLLPVTVWEELRSTIRTDSHGIFSLVVGSGVRQSSSSVASFNEINWSASQLYIKTQIYIQGIWKNMGSAKLWTVPYSMVAGDLNGTLKKLSVTGETASMDEALFEVKNKTGQTVFAVYNEGVRIYVDDGLKGAKGGFAIGGFGGAKAPSQDYFVVKPDTVRIYIDDTQGKIAKGGFAIGGFGTGKAKSQQLFVVNPDSIRAYIDTNTGKGAKGGFAIGGFGGAKDGNKNFLDVATDASGIINPSQNRVLWYPLKNAFLVGRVLIENPDSVGVNSFATGYESKAIGSWSQALGYKPVARGNYATAIGKYATANGESSYSFGTQSTASGPGSYAFGLNAKASSQNALSIGQNTFASQLNAIAIGYNSLSSGENSFSVGVGDTATGKNSFSMGSNSSSGGMNTFSIGSFNQSSGVGSFAIGALNTASSYASFSMGYGCHTADTMAFAIGLGSSALGKNSVAIGTDNVSSGRSSFALGIDAYSTGLRSLAIFGNSTADSALSIYGTASGKASVAIGRDTRANGHSSFAIGYGFRTPSANPPYYDMHETMANKDYSISMGLASVSDHSWATAIGVGTSTPCFGSYVIGAFNDQGIGGDPDKWVETDPFFVIGNGYLDFSTNQVTQRNALVMLKNGDTGIGTDYPAAKLDVGGTVKLGKNGSVLNSVIKVTVSMDLPSIASMNSYTATFNVFNATTGSVVYISPENALPDGLIISYARISASGLVEGKILNTSGDAIDLPLMNWDIAVIE